MGMSPQRREACCHLLTLLLILCGVVGLFVGLLVGLQHASSSSAPHRRVLWLSDLHLDPFYNATISDASCCRYNVPPTSVAHQTQTQTQTPRQGCHPIEGHGVVVCVC